MRAFFPVFLGGLQQRVVEATTGLEKHVVAAVALKFPKNRLRLK